MLLNRVKNCLEEGGGGCRAGADFEEDAGEGVGQVGHGCLKFFVGGCEHVFEAEGLREFLYVYAGVGTEVFFAAVEF